jgi:hypothetical protein
MLIINNTSSFTKLMNGLIVQRKRTKMATTPRIQADDAMWQFSVASFSGKKKKQSLVLPWDAFPKRIDRRAWLTLDQE